MKKISIVLSAFFVTLLSCNNDDDHKTDKNLSETEIPSPIKTYVTTHFPSNTIDRAVMDTENNLITYDIYLSGNVELEFNSAFEIIDIDGRAQLPDSVIPSAILDYVAQNYPNNFITDWDLERDHQQIELDNGLDLEFTMTGEFIRIDG